MWVWLRCCVLQDKVLRVDLTGGHVVDGGRLQTVIVILKHHEAMVAVTYSRPHLCLTKEMLYGIKGIFQFHTTRVYFCSFLSVIISKLHCKLIAEIWKAATLLRRRQTGQETQDVRRSDRFSTNPQVSQTYLEEKTKANCKIMTLTVVTLMDCKHPSQSQQFNMDVILELNTNGAHLFE